jgi:hypothetical protein
MQKKSVVPLAKFLAWGAIGFFGLIANLYFAAFAFANFLQGTAMELPAKILAGMGRIHLHHVVSEIEVNGEKLSIGTAFQAQRSGFEYYLVYLASQESDGGFTLLNVFPEQGTVGISGNASANSAMLVGKRVLLRSDVTYGVVPFGMSVKSVMAPTRMQVQEDGAFVFTAMPDCSEIDPALSPDTCLAKARRMGSWYGWQTLPFGEWRIRFEDN